MPSHSQNWLNQNLKTILLLGLIMATGFFFGKLYTENQALKAGIDRSATGQPVKVNQPPSRPQGPDKTTLAKMPEITEKDYRRGPKDAQVTLVEYSDYECPFCKRFHPTMTQVMDKYGDKVAWVYRHFPLAFHANAQKAAEAAECAGADAGQKAFWKFTDLYFERTNSNGTGFPLDQLADLAAEAGANKVKVQKCLDDGTFAQKVKDQMAGGQAAGVSGTPGTIVVTKDGPQEIIPGALPYEQVEQIIKKYLDS